MGDEYESHVFLVCEATTREDFVALALREHWHLAAESVGDGKITGFAQAWVAADGKTEIHYVEEPGLGGVRFVLIKGPGINDIIDIIGIELQLRTSINVVRHALSAQSDEQKSESAYELAAVFPTFNSQAMDILKGYYSFGSDQVRIRVVQALTYRGWPEGLEFLDEIAKSDDYPELRQYAAKMATMLRSQK
jgi:hypothetical protein